MSLQPIPAAWRVAVCTALKSGRYRFTADAYRDWQNGFPGAFRPELLADFVKILSLSNLHGCPVPMDSPPGVTWEFWFLHLDFKAYGKLLLCADGLNVVIFSAHHPRQATLRCE